GWAKDPTGKTIAIVEDLNNPGHMTNANTGQPVPEGTEKINVTQITAQMRQDSYGAYGNFFRAKVGEGYSEPEARLLAGEMVDKQFNVQLSAAEQNIAIKRITEGV